MYFTDLFIKRPVFATAINLLILLAGLVAYFKLPLRQFPKIDATVINVVTPYTGGSASLIEGFITNPIENALLGIDGLDYVTSESTSGQSNITLHFKLGYNVDNAMTDVANKVASSRYRLPENIDDPLISKNDPGNWPILFIALTDPNMSRVEINDYIVRTLQPTLSTLPGVGEIMMFGNLNYVMRIWLNPYEMASHQITATDVLTALNNNNVQAPSGEIKSSEEVIDVAANTNLEKAYWFNQLPIKKANNQVIRIQDIGEAKLGTPEQQTEGLINGVNGNVFGIIPRSDANPLEVADITKKTLADLQSQLPTGMKAQVIWDNAEFIAESIKEVKRTLIEATLFVVCVIFLFLGSLRTVLIPAVTIPLSLIGVCTILFACGYSLNTLTFLALVLAIGMVVDDAIVVSENIHRQIENGKNSFDAAIFGTREIRFAVIAMTLTLAAVYSPILFMGGLTGALFKEFALTLAGTVIISGFISLTLSPMMCSKILAHEENYFSQKIYQATQITTHYYANALTHIMRFKKSVFAFMLLVLSGLAVVYYFLPQELAPKEDVGGIFTLMNGPTSANLDYTKKYSLEADKIISQIPEVQTRLLLIGNGGANSAWAFARLKPWNQRTRNIDDIINPLQGELAKIPGLTAFALNPFRLPGASGRQEINFVIKTTKDYQELSEIAEKIKLLAEKEPSLSNVDFDLKMDKPQIEVNINRQLAADLGISMREIGNTISLAFSTPRVNPFSMNGRSYDVAPQILPEYRRSEDALNYLYLATGNNQLVPLTNIIDVEERVIPESLNHFQQMRAAQISASAAPGYTVGDAVIALERIAKQTLPADMQYDFAGSTRQFIDSSQTMQILILLALATIFLVLGAQFESFIDPFIVMLTVPLSAFGGLALLKIAGGSMNVYTEIGLVTLIGLISKHGILLVEFANQQLEQGQAIQHAIVTAAKTRLRPILMTTAAMILGALPLVLASGPGANARAQIGYVIIGGMFVGTIFTLFVVPTFYVLLKSFFNKKRPKLSMA